MIGFLERLGYKVVRQRGSHVRLELERGLQTFRITVPRHKEIAVGTLSRILKAVSIQTGLGFDELVERLRGQ